MTEQLDDVWATRDYPVLREAARLADRGELPARDSQVANGARVTQPIAYMAAKALQRRGLVVLDEGYGREVTFMDVTGPAYLMTGLHPDPEDPLAALVRALNDEADRQPDEQEQGRLRTAAGALAAITRTVGQGVLTAYLTGQLPGH